MSFASLGAKAPMLSSSGSVTGAPISPMIDTKTIRRGKIESTP
jgi:hypothetical protein